MNTLKQVHDWLFETTPEEPKEDEPVTTRRFIFMAGLGIAVIALAEVLLT